MSPTSYKDLIKLTAQQLNQPEELVRDLILMYYKNRREKLSNLSFMRVKVCGIGNFTVRHWSVPYQIKRCERMLLAIRKKVDGYWKKTAIENLEWKLWRLTFILENCEGFKKVKLKKKKIRIKMHEDDKRNKRLEKQKKNIGGNLEQLVS